MESQAEEIKEVVETTSEPLKAAAPMDLSSLPPKPAANGSASEKSPTIEKSATFANADLPPTPISASHRSTSNAVDGSENKSHHNASGKKIFVASLPEDTTEEDLQLCFGAIGPLVNVELKKGFGFVEFKEAADAQKACQEYDGGKFLDATIHVSLSHGAGKKDGPSHCYRCGQEGHWANSRHCPLYKEANDNRRRDRESRPDNRGAPGDGGRRGNGPRREPDRNFPPRAGSNYPPQSAPLMPDYPYRPPPSAAAAAYSRDPRMPYPRDPYARPDFRDAYPPAAGARDARGPPPPAQYGPGSQFPPYYDPYRDAPPPRGYEYPPMDERYMYYPPPDFYGPASAPLPYGYDRPPYGYPPRAEPSYLPPRARTPERAGREFNGAASRNGRIPNQRGRSRSPPGRRGMPNEPIGAPSYVEGLNPIRREDDLRRMPPAVNRP